MFAKHFVVVFIFTLGFKHGYSIRCYACNSWNNSMCLDPTTYDQETLKAFMPVVECSHSVLTASREDFFCRKITQTVLRKGYNSDVRVTRGCGWVRSHRECYKADNEDHLETVCQCFSDGCNSAPGFHTSAVLLTTAAILNFVLARS